MRTRIAICFGWSMFLSLGGLAATADSDVRLVEAMKNQDTNAVHALIQQGVDVNVPYTDSTTALHWAAYWEDAEAAALLLRGRRQPQRDERARSAPTAPRLSEPNRRGGRRAAPREGQAQPGSADRGNAAHDLRANWKYGGCEGAHCRWRPRQCQGEYA